MPSPFPGMDPYLEGEEWHDAHQRLANEISDQLAPQISPRYIARLAIAYTSDIPTKTEIEVSYPDIEILRRRREANLSRPNQELAGGVMVMDLPITKSVMVPLPIIKTKLVTVEIRETETNRLVTSIEVLSPVNKRKPGITKFIEKRERLMKAGVHLLDIDFIRRGKCPIDLPEFTQDHPISQAHYRVILTRAKTAHLNIWPIRVEEKLPIVAVPLHPPDSDVPLDLGLAFSTIYNRAFYDLSIDYSQPPPPPSFDEKVKAWMEALLREYEAP